MKSSRDIEKMFKNLNDTTNAELDERVLRDASQTMENLNRLNVWRIIMKSRITKLAVAAVVILLVFLFTVNNLTETSSIQKDTSPHYILYNFKNNHANLKEIKTCDILPIIPN